jgi:hypothetical protein
MLVFGELRGQNASVQALVAGGSLVMIAGAILISRAEASQAERQAWDQATARECERYGMDYAEAQAAVHGEGSGAGEGGRRGWWEMMIVAVALAIFAWLGSQATRQPISISVTAAAVLSAAAVGLLVYAGWALWRKTRFE